MKMEGFGRRCKRRVLHGVYGIGIAACVTACGSLPDGDPVATLESTYGTPYPASTVIESITWEFDPEARRAPGSDLWPTTWGADGHIYTAWGDGGGFRGTNTAGRVSLGFARIEGPPENLTAVNVWGGTDAENPAQFEGKSAGLISVDGTLYAAINLQNRPMPYPDTTVAWSEDLARTWETATWVFTGGDGSFRLGAFLNFGQDNANARDEYVYFYGHHVGDTTAAYMGRAPSDRLRDQATYEYFAGLNAMGQPGWSSDIEQGEPFFVDSNGVGGFSMSYNEPLDRYILTTAHGSVSRLGVFEAPEPWGPWSTVDYYANWGGYGDGDGAYALLYSIPTKWIADDGLTFWMIYSAYDPPDRNLDSFNLVKGTLNLLEQ